jgi:hypothetical protein
MVCMGKKNFQPYPIFVQYDAALFPYAKCCDGCKLNFKDLLKRNLFYIFDLLLAIMLKSFKNVFSEQKSF